MSKRAEKNTKIEGYNTIVCPNPQCKADQGTLQSKFSSISADCVECGKEMLIQVVSAYVTTPIQAIRRGLPPVDGKVVMPANAYPGESKIGTNDIDPEPPPAVREQMAANRVAGRVAVRPALEPEDPVAKVRREQAERMQSA